MILSTHVDDLKGGARKAVALKLLAHLEAKFGPCKAEWQKFTHTGVEHERLPNGVWCHQGTYTAALKPLELTSIKGRPIEELVLADLASKFASLLGGVAWIVLTRAEIAIYVQALQRRASGPRVTDCRRINVLVRYVTRHQEGLWYEAVSGNIRLLGFTDSAFKAQEEESSGLALRGLAIIVAPERRGEEVLEPGRAVTVNLLEWLVRRLRRVVRSTFAAELNALIDSIESLILLQLVLHQVYCGTDDTAEGLLLKLEHGHLYPPIDLFVDARSVSDAISASDVCTPQEASLRLHLITVRDRLVRGLIRSLSWTDTRDMVADPLTKGGVDRTLLTRVMSGTLHVAHQLKTKWGKTAHHPELISAVWSVFEEEVGAVTATETTSVAETAPVTTAAETTSAAGVALTSTSCPARWLRRYRR